MDGVKVALGNRGMTVEAGRQCAKIGKSGKTCYHATWPSVLSAHSPVLWWLLPGGGWDAVT